MSIPIRPNVLSMIPYPPGRPIEQVQRELGITDVIKLASNENPLGPSPKAIEAAIQACRAVNLYPDAAIFELKSALAKHYNVEPSQIVVGNGSDEILTFLGQAIISDPSDEVLVGDPSFIRYDAIASLAPCQLVRVPVNADYKLDLVAMAAAITPRTKIVFLTNPNNPTGTYFTSEELTAFLAKVPENIAVVLDEAYCEFAAEFPGYPNSLERLAGDERLIILRTFSKAYGLAGLRVGYGIMHASIASVINALKAPFNVNSVAQIAATAALHDTEFLQRTIENNRREMERISAALTSLGCRVIPSAANFVLVDFGVPTQDLFERLMRHGVIVRPGAQLGLPTMLRISIGCETETNRLLMAIQAEVKHEVTA